MKLAPNHKYSQLFGRYIMFWTAKIFSRQMLGILEGVGGILWLMNGVLIQKRWSSHAKCKIDEFKMWIFHVGSHVFESCYRCWRYPRWLIKLLKSFLCWRPRNSKSFLRCSTTLHDFTEAWGPVSRVKEAFEEKAHRQLDMKWPTKSGIPAYEGEAVLSSIVSNVRFISGWDLAMHRQIMIKLWAAIFQ